MLSYSFGNEFHLHVNENRYSDEMMSARTHFEKGAKDNTEIPQKMCESEVNLLTGYSEMACVAFSNLQDLELGIRCHGIEKFKLVL